MLKIGEIISCEGSDIVALMQQGKKPPELETARRLYGRPVYLNESRSSPLLGKIKDVIGRTDKPYLVISLSRGFKVKGSRVDLSKKPVYSPVNL